MDFLNRASEIADKLVEYRRHQHMHPELGMDMEGAVAYVSEALQAIGCTPERVGRSGVVTTIGKPGGKVFLLRADMDALPIQEESGLSFASQVPNRAHCCGHDLHTAMLLGAAQLLKEREGELDGMVKLMFQPGEETMEGAKDMLEAGVLENPHVDAAMAIHVNSIVPTGRMLVFYGPVCASSDLFSIRVQGKGGHGSRPDETIDPINAACHIHLALQELQARELKAGETGVLTIGSIHGGLAHNVIPDAVEMLGTIRTYNKDVRQMLIQRLKEISEKVADAFRAKAEVIMDNASTIPLVVDEQTAAQVRDSLREMLPAQQVIYLSKIFPASEDFAYITDRVPSAFVILGAAIKEKPEFGQHHPKVRFDERCLPIGAAAYAQAATQWLNAHRA